MAERINVLLPALKTVSEANSHQHWRARQKRAKEQRGFARMLLEGPLRRSGWLVPPEPKLLVTLTRLAPSSGLDDDNLASSQKHVRDGIADALSIDDRDPRVQWAYKQERSKKYGVRVEISER